MLSIAVFACFGPGGLQLVLSQEHLYMPVWVFLKLSGFRGDRAQGGRGVLQAPPWCYPLFCLPFTSFSTLAFRLASPQSWLNPKVCNIFWLFNLFFDCIDTTCSLEKLENRNK